MAEYHKDSNSTIHKINNAYDKAIKDINEDINKIFYNYQVGGDLSVTEARKFLNSCIPNPIIKLMNKVMKYIKNEDIKKYLLSRVNANAYKARITRLEALKESIYINTKIVADAEVNQSTKLYTDNINRAYYTNLFDIQKGLGIGFNVAKMPTETIQEILKNNWSGKHYSKRIWHNTDVLAEKLEEVITSGLMSGKSSRKVAQELQDLSDYGKHAAERLIRTETTYISNMAELESYKEAGIDKYIFIATLDIRTSTVCREHDRKVYKVSEGAAGVNLPPLHPYCRSTTRAYLGESTLRDIKRRARDSETGKTYLVPGDISYNEWYDKYVVSKYGKDKTEVFERMIKNKSSDRKQFNEYKKALGNLVPSTFGKFQDLKYNSSEAWSKLKDLYNGNYSEDELADIKNFFSKLFGDKNSSDTINLNIKKLPKKHYNNIMKYIENSPVETRNIVNKNMSEINFKDINFTDGVAKYSPKEKGIYVDINSDFLNIKGKGQYTTVFHEMGHLIDHRLNNISIRDKHFRNLIIEDVNSFINEYAKLNNIDNLDDSPKLLREELRSDKKYHSISDLFGGVTNNEIVGRFKHSKDYWKNPKKLPKEAFAHFFEATLRNDEYKLELIRKIFSKSYPEFLKMLGDE